MTIDDLLMECDPCDVCGAKANEPCRPECECLDCEQDKDEEFGREYRAQDEPADSDFDDLPF